MTEILVYIPAIIMILGGGYVTLLGFKIIKPKKDNPEHQEKMLKWHHKFGKFMKVIGPLLLIWGLLNLIFPELNSFKQSSKNWTQEQKDEMIKQTINGSNYLKSINQDTAMYVAKDFVDNYTTKYTLDEAWAQDKLTPEQRMDIILPMMKESMKKYRLKTQD